jgi:hypothetical protein
MSEKVLSTLAAIIAVAASDATVGGNIESIELLNNTAVVELSIGDMRYTVTIAETSRRSPIIEK